MTRLPRPRGRAFSSAALVLAALAALAAVGCGGEPPAASDRPGEGAAPSLAVQTVAVESLEPMAATATGTVYARQRATLTARLATSVRSLPVEEGAAVRSGQVVVRLDDTALRAALAGAEAQRAAAVADAERFARLLEREAATPREAEGFSVSITPAPWVPSLSLITCGGGPNSESRSPVSSGLSPNTVAGRPMPCAASNWWQRSLSRALMIASDGLGL